MNAFDAAFSLFLDFCFYFFFFLLFYCTMKVHVEDDEDRQRVSLPLLFLDNLQLLGFDQKQHASDEFFHGVSLDNRVFANEHDAVVNALAFECTSHFLFTRVDPLRSTTLFRGCWPFQDYERDSRRYRQCAREWLLALEAQSDLVGLQVPVAACDFAICSGNGFLVLMVAFSTYALQLVLDRDLADPRGKPIRLSARTNAVPLAQIAAAIPEIAKYTHQRRREFMTMTTSIAKHVAVMRQRIDTQDNDTQQGDKEDDSDVTWLDEMREDMLVMRDRQHDIYRRYRQYYGCASPYRRDSESTASTASRRASMKHRAWPPDLFTLPSLLSEMDGGAQMEAIRSFTRDRAKERGIVRTAASAKKARRQPMANTT
ncbi:HAUS augmin-like complex subunit 6 N-terminus-domain-containing protein [Gongronella butleri]|nr:HAUS augmin-like complex subunit 6 N-terminus-domain-containing protein [Gongronella butleri]